MATPKTWEEFTQRYELLKFNVKKALDNYFDNTYNDKPIPELKPEERAKVISNALDHVIGTNEEIGNQINSLLNDVSASLRQSNIPRGDDFSPEAINAQTMGVETPEPSQSRQVPDWAKSLMDSPSDPRMRQQQPAATSAEPAALGAENRNELTPSYKMKMGMAPGLDSFKKRLEQDLSYKPKPKPTPY